MSTDAGRGDPREIAAQAYPFSVNTSLMAPSSLTSPTGVDVPCVLT